jgi:hypothetical protein
LWAVSRRKQRRRDPERDRLESSRPARRGHAAGDGRGVDRREALGEELGGAHGGGGVLQLVLAGEREIEIVRGDRRAQRAGGGRRGRATPRGSIVTVSRATEWSGAPRRAAAAASAAAASACSTITAGTPARRMPAFSPAIAASVSPSSARWSKPMRVITERIGIHGVRRVEPAAQADLEDGELDALLLEVDEGDGGQRLEDGRRRQAGVTRRGERRSRFAASVASSIGTPSTRIRSPKESRCGEV